MPADWINRPPSKGDIVAAYFPETNPKGAIELRPCLVIAVYEDEDYEEGGDLPQYSVEIYFGTKNIKTLTRAQIDLVVQNHADMEAMGLPYATRFDLAESSKAQLPWDEESFGCWTGFPHPVIGFLDDDYQEMLEQRLARQARRKSRAA